MNEDTELTRYQTLLQKHDWHYQYSDDHRVWTRGRDEAAAIADLKRKVDPTGEIYRQYAPKVI